MAAVVSPYILNFHHITYRRISKQSSPQSPQWKFQQFSSNFISTYDKAFQRNFTCSLALSIEYSESYMNLTAYVSRSSVLKSVQTAVHVKRKWTVGSEGREDSVVFRCQQYRSIFAKVRGRVDYMLFVTKHTIGLIEMRPPARATDTPLFLRKTVALTWNIVFLFRDKHGYILFCVLCLFTYEYILFFHRSESF
jgi:hypothetical protein